MKTYKEFRSNIDEGIGAALGLGLTAWSGYNAVSYTHLTLPRICSV